MSDSSVFPHRSKAQVRCRVVAIDYNASALLVIVRALEMRGHEVHSASDAPNGVALVKSVEPDVVICGFNLFDTTGCTVAEEIRSTEIKQPLLIVHTSHFESVILERAMAAGFDLRLPKPFPFEALYRAVESSVGEADCADLRLSVVLHQHHRSRTQVGR